MHISKLLQKIAIPTRCVFRRTFRIGGFCL